VKFVRFFAAGAVCAIPLLVSAKSVHAAIAQRTIVLQTDTPPAAPLNVTWNPTLRQYYAAGAGSGEPMYSKGYVFSETGTLLQTFSELEHDLRSINYNPNTNKLEAMTFNARDGGIGTVGGRPQGLFEANLDAGGLFTGSTSMLLGALPGNLGRQTMPVYDAGRNEFYAFSNTNIFNRVSRADGSLLGTIALDTTPIGNPGFTWFASGFDSQNDLLVVVSPATDDAYTFRRDGTYVETWELDIDVPSFYGAGFANGQLFVYDQSRNAWQGYDISSSSPVCNDIDFNNDGSSFDPQDIDAFLSVFSEGPCIPETATCDDIDFNNDTSIFDPCDIDSFLLVFSEGPCTLCGQ
jgi:hypothetical protein